MKSDNKWREVVKNGFQLQPGRTVKHIYNLGNSHFMKVRKT